jgi:hypothetical protein
MKPTFGGNPNASAAFQPQKMASGAAAMSREAARNYVDFRIKDDSEVFMLICGMALVDAILQKQGRANCVVSAQGVRFGYLYQMLAG